MYVNAHVHYPPKKYKNGPALAEKYLEKALLHSEHYETEPTGTNKEDKGRNRTL